MKATHAALFTPVITSIMGLGTRYAVDNDHWVTLGTAGGGLWLMLKGRSPAFSKTYSAGSREIHPSC